MYNLGGNRRWVPLTGAAVCDFSDVIQWLNVVELAKTSQIRRCPENAQLPTKDLYYATLKYRKLELTESMYVVNNQKCSLLSERACVQLGLKKRADKDFKGVNNRPTGGDFKVKFPALFSGQHRLKTDNT